MSNLGAGAAAADWHGSMVLGSSDSALLETLVLEAPVAFAFYDTDLRYRRINRMLADINALPMAAHLGRRPAEVLPAPLGQQIEQRLRTVLRTGEVLAEEDFTAESPVTGELRHYQSQWYPALAADGEVLGVAVLITDVTDRRRAEAALRRSNERTLRLQEATAALAGALTVDEVRRVMAGLRRPHDDVEAGALFLGDEALGRPPAGDRHVDLPLAVSGGRIGTLRVPRPEGGVGPQTQAFLSALAGQCAIALERARLYERERSTAAALQRSLLPDRLPALAGVGLAARFLPGAPDAEVGGDWYDAFALPDGRLALVVGDVMGKGVVAAAGMGRLRSALRALSFVDPRPSSVLGGLDRVFTGTEEDDQIATLVYLVVDPATGRTELGGAGHLPLVLVRAGPPPELVDAGSGSTPLGWPEVRRTRTLDLGPGDLLLGVTDGVVERRGYDLDEGLAQLLAAVGTPEADLDRLVDRVAQEMLGESLGRDDATLLAVRVTG